MTNRDRAQRRPGRMAIGMAASAAALVGLAAPARAEDVNITSSTPVARDSLALDTGATLALGDRWNVGFAYSAQIAAAAHSHRFSAKATFRF